MKILKNLSKPGSYPPIVVFFISLIIMIAIFVLDLPTPLDIYLHVLYVFPLAAIALHCKQTSAVIIGFVLSAIFQLTDYFTQGLAALPIIVNAIVFLGAAILVAFLARSARENYFESVKIATTDWLTGLHNRRGFELLADMEIERQKRYGGTFSLALIDLDNFKSLNDSAGHHAGDMALKGLGKTLRESTRHTDLIGRMGGDEFAILMPNTKRVDCIFYCEKLLLKIKKSMADDSFNITASIGCMTLEQPPGSVSEMLKNVDKGLYAAKESGKDCVCNFDLPIPSSCTHLRVAPS